MKALFYTVASGQPQVCMYPSASAFPWWSILQKDARVLWMWRSVLHAQSRNKVDESECRWRLWTNQNKLHYRKCQQQFWSVPQKLDSLTNVCWDKFIFICSHHCLFLPSIPNTDSSLQLSQHLFLASLVLPAWQEKSCYKSPWRV